MAVADRSLSGPLAGQCCQWLPGLPVVCQECRRTAAAASGAVAAAPPAACAAGCCCLCSCHGGSTPSQWPVAETHLGQRTGPAAGHMLPTGQCDVSAWRVRPTCQQRLRLHRVYMQMQALCEGQWLGGMQTARAQHIAGQPAPGASWPLPSGLTACTCRCRRAWQALACLWRRWNARPATKKGRRTPTG